MICYTPPNLDVRTKIGIFFFTDKSIFPKRYICTLKDINRNSKNQFQMYAQLKRTDKGHNWVLKKYTEKQEM